MTDLEFWKQREEQQTDYIFELKQKYMNECEQQTKIRITEIYTSATGVLDNIRNEIKQLTK